MVPYARHRSRSLEMRVKALRVRIGVSFGAFGARTVPCLAAGFTSGSRRPMPMSHERTCVFKVKELMTALLKYSKMALATSYFHWMIYLLLCGYGNRPCLQSVIIRLSMPVILDFWSWSAYISA